MKTPVQTIIQKQKKNKAEINITFMWLMSTFHMSPKTPLLFNYSLEHSNREYWQKTKYVLI